MRNPKRLQPIAIRSVQANQFSFDDDNLNVSGYVNETGKRSDPIPNFGEVPVADYEDEPGEFVEIMQPGVFQDAINNADFVDFYFEHEPDRYLASTQQGSLKLNEDNTGLKMSANITPTSWGKDAYTLIKSGAVQSMSFGFIPLEDKWDLNGDVPVRTVTKIQLLEVSAVRFPAYPDSSIDARKKRFKHLNKIFEKRGYTLKTARKGNKRGVSNMTKSQVKKTERRDSNSAQGLTSSDAQNIASALNNLVNAVNNNTNAVQENSEVGSDFASKVMQAMNDDRSKEAIHKGSKKSEKRNNKDKSNLKATSKKAKETPRSKGSSKRAKESKANADKVSGKYAEMFKNLKKLNA